MKRSADRSPDPIAAESGTVMVLTLGFVLLALLLTTVVIDASVVFLARRSLLAACDSAALAAAQRLDANRAYRLGTGGTGATSATSGPDTLPLDAGHETGVGATVRQWQHEQYPDDEALVLSATTDGRTVTVRGHELVSLPFGAVLRILGIGPVTVTASSQAQAQSVP